MSRGEARGHVRRGLANRAEQSRVYAYLAPVTTCHCCSTGPSMRLNSDELSIVHDLEPPRELPCECKTPGNLLIEFCCTSSNNGDFSPVELDDSAT